MPTRKSPVPIESPLPPANPDSRVGDVLIISDLEENFMDWSRPTIAPHALSHMNPRSADLIPGPSETLPGLVPPLPRPGPLQFLDSRGDWSEPAGATLPNPTSYVFRTNLAFTGNEQVGDIVLPDPAVIVPEWATLQNFVFNFTSLYLMNQGNAGGLPRGSWTIEILCDRSDGRGRVWQLWAPGVLFTNTFPDARLRYASIGPNSGTGGLNYPVLFEFPNEPDIQYRLVCTVAPPGEAFTLRSGIMGSIYYY